MCSHHQTAIRSINSFRTDLSTTTCSRVCVCAPNFFHIPRSKNRYRQCRKSSLSNITLTGEHNVRWSIVVGDVYMWNMERTEGQIESNYQSWLSCTFGGDRERMFHRIRVQNTFFNSFLLLALACSVWMSPDDRIALLFCPMSRVVWDFKLNWIFFLRLYFGLKQRWHRKSILALLCSLANIFRRLPAEKKKVLVFKAFRVCFVTDALTGVGWEARLSQTFMCFACHIFIVLQSSATFSWLLRWISTNMWI